MLRGFHTAGFAAVTAEPGNTQSVCSNGGGGGGGVQWQDVTGWQWEQDARGDACMVHEGKATTCAARGIPGAFTTSPFLTPPRRRTGRSAC